MTDHGGPRPGPADEPRPDVGPTPPAGESSAETLAAVIAEIRQIHEQLDRLLRIRIDRAKLRWRSRALGLAWIGLIGILAATAIVLGVSYTMAGLTAALAVAFGGRPWLGNLAGGLIALAGAAAVSGAAKSYLRRRGLSRMRNRYEAGSEEVRKGELP